MKFFISIILLIFSVDAVDIIEANSNYRYQSPLLIQAAAALGCASGCIYEPLNVPQLPVCVVTTHLGANMIKLFTCGTAVDQDACALVKEPNGADMCDWTPLSTFFKLGDGVCLPKIISAHKTAIMSALSAFKPQLDQRSSITVRSFMRCLVKTTQGTEACKRERGCEMCTDIPANNFPMTPALTELCHPGYHNHCDLLKTPSADLKFCPGKDPTYQTLAAEVGKLPCYKDQCPKTECTKTCPQTCPAGSATTPSTTPAPTNTTVPNTGYTADSIVMLMSCIMSLYILM